MTIFEALDHPWLNVSTILYLLQRVQLLVHTNHKIIDQCLSFLSCMIGVKYLYYWCIHTYYMLWYHWQSHLPVFTILLLMIIFPLKITSCILTVSIYFINKILVTLCISCSTLNLQKGEKTKLFDLQCCK